MSPSQRVSPCKPKPKTFETARVNAEYPFIYPKAALKDYLICDGSSDLCESKHTTQSDASFERWTRRATPSHHKDPRVHAAEARGVGGDFKGVRSIRAVTLDD